MSTALYDVIAPHRVRAEFTGAPVAEDAVQRDEPVLGLRAIHHDAWES